MLLAAPRLLFAQERGAMALGEAVAGLGVNTRVLMIGAHPDDEDTFLIAWLSRGRHVETAYLSLTRGDGGQNLIGNELGEALGVIRTEELLAARRIDGARQYFTRAYDFGFSKDTIDTYKHWPRDSLLADVIRVVRAFRPHVIVAVFSGTPRDGHGHHQVSGLLARAAYELSGDTLRFPLARLESPWIAATFYRAARFSPEEGTVRIDVGEYSALLGRSYAEIAGESRSQHKSQGFGVLQRKGPILDFVRREASRVDAQTLGAGERSLFDGIDTSWSRFRPIAADARAAAALDSLPAAFGAARAAFDPFGARTLIPALTRVQRLLFAACPPSHDWTCVTTPPRDATLRRDMGASADIAGGRVRRALQLALGLELEAVAPRELMPVGATFPVAVSVYNRGRDTVTLTEASTYTAPFRRELMVSVPPGGVWRDTLRIGVPVVGQPWWLERPRRGAMFDIGSAGDGGVPDREWSSPVTVSALAVRGRDTTYVPLTTTISYRVADPVKGELWRAVAGTPAVAVTLGARAQYVPSNAVIDRRLDVTLRSADDRARTVRVSLTLPAGLTADSVSRTVTLAGYDARQTVSFRIRGRLPAGEHRITALAASEGETFSSGYELVDYDHVRRQRIYRPASMTLSAVDVRLPAGISVAYVSGVGDNVAPALVQLGIPVTILPADAIARTDLRPFTTVVVGPRAYEAHPELITANAKLLDFARSGGTLVVQYGQYEMTQPGVMPYPITLTRPADRVTDEDAPVTVVAPGARELGAPNRIGAADFAGWVQERALYMPRAFDEHYRPLFAMNDAGEPANRGAVLVAPFGSGTYVYATLSFFRQLPAGVPGAARLFVNLLSAGLEPRLTP